MTENDIDEILAHSMRRTEMLNESLAKIEDKFNLNNVSLTGDEPERNHSASIYTFDGETYRYGSRKAGGAADDDGR